MDIPLGGMKFLFFNWVYVFTKPKFFDFRNFDPCPSGRNPSMKHKTFESVLDWFAMFCEERNGLKGSFTKELF